MFIFCLILLAFSVNLSTALERIWSEGQYPYEGRAIELSFEAKTESFSSDNKLEIKVTSTYPMFHSKSLFFQKVNDQLQDNAQQVFFKYIQKYEQEEKEEGDLDEEACCMDFDKRDISYSLTPTYATSSLVSVFGELYRYGGGMLHGCSHYTSHNYWFDGKEIQEISLSSLFLSDKNFADFLTHFCLSTLEKEHIGYCDIPIEITLEDIQVFTLSKSGLTITFRPYHVGGWADGPYSITIPFESLKPFINLQGPLREFF